MNGKIAERYCYQIDYDWKKLEYLVSVLHDAHVLVGRDLNAFDEFLHMLRVAPICSSPAPVSTP